MRIYRSSTHFINQNGFLIKRYHMNRPTYTHTHDFVELVYLLSGHGTHTIDGTDYTMLPGSFFVVAPGQSHSLIFDEEAEYYNIFLTVAYLKDFTADSVNGTTAYDILCGNEAAALYFDTESAESIETLFQNMYCEFNNKKYLHSEMIQCLFKMMLFEILRARAALVSKNVYHKSHLALPRVLDYVNAHFDEPLYLKDISEKYHYNPAYFGRLFRKTYGISYDEYIQQKRIERAKELLTTTNFTIDRIIASVGFTNKNNFYRAFSALCGCTPRQYRQSEDSTDDTLAVTEP